MTMFSLIPGFCKNSFVFFPYFYLYLTSLQTAKIIFIKSPVLRLFNSKFKPNKYTPTQN